MTAARRYKDVIAAVTGGLDAAADRNTARVEELKEQVPALHRQLTDAAARADLVRIAAHLAWDDAVELLWVESWMDMRPFPRPDAFTKPVDALVAAAEVEAAAAALRAATKR